MPVARPAPNDTENTDISYPLDLMRDVGLALMKQATQNLSTHQNLWNTIQQWIDDSAPTFSTWTLGGTLIDVRSYLTNVLASHAQRLQDSYEWQMSIGQALIDAVVQISAVEQQISNGFTTDEGTSIPSSQTSPSPRHGSVR